MKKYQVKSNDLAVISDNLVFKGKIISDTAKVSYGRKKERSTKSRRKKK